MTTKIEKQFFDTFGIEPVTFINTTTYSSDGVFYYPLITDQKLLELICIVNMFGGLPKATTAKNIKEKTLRILMRVQKYKQKYFPDNYSTAKFSKKIRKVFKECEYDR